MADKYLPWDYPFWIMQKGDNEKPPHKEAPTVKLSFRTSPDLRDKLQLVANRAGTSVNAWMEEVLSAGADDALGRIKEDVTIQSPAVKKLIEDPESSIKLVDQVADQLESLEYRSVLRFQSALKRLLISLDGLWQIIPPLRREEQLLIRLTDAALPLLKEEPSLIVQFSKAFKDFLLSLSGLQTYLKEDGQALSYVLSTIERMLVQMESDSGDSSVER